MIVLQALTPTVIAAEFKVALGGIPDLKSAIREFAPGRQRGYPLSFRNAKMAKTRQARIEKHVDLILGA